MTQPAAAPARNYAQYRPVAHVVLLILAIVCFGFFAWAGFNHPSKDEFGFAGLGLVLFAASFI